MAAHLHFECTKQLGAVSDDDLQHGVRVLVQQRPEVEIALQQTL